MNNRISLSVILLLPLIISPTAALAQTIQIPFDSSYSFVDLGSVPGVPSQYGGLTIKAGDTDTLLIGGNANTVDGQIFAVEVIRDGDNHIIGFSGSAAVEIDAGFNNGGVDYGPGDVLFLARWPVNELGQAKPGSAITDKIIDLVPLGVTPSPGGVTFVPPGFPLAGHVKLVSWAGGEFYDATISPDGGGTFDLVGVTQMTTILGGPEGFVYVPIGSAEFPNLSILVSEFSANQITTYEIDGNSDPIVGTRTVFMTGLTGAEGATIDPLTGDFLFSTFGGGSRVIVVQGFEIPSEPSAVGGEFLSIDSAALLLAGIQSSAIWMLPVLAGAVGVGITAFKLRRK